MRNQFEPYGVRDRKGTGETQSKYPAEIPHRAFLASVAVPGMLGLIATRSTDEEVQGSPNWSREADFGRTYVLGSDARKHQLVADITTAFRKGKQHYIDTPGLTAGALYDFVCNLAAEAGWEFGAPTAGHLIGHFPHEHAPGAPKPFSIRHGNELRLRELDAHGAPRHWILEIHFIDRAREFSGFYEELLTIGPAT